MAQLIIIDFFNKKLVKKVEAVSWKEKEYLERWKAFVDAVGIRKVDPLEYPRDIRKIKLPYCPMRDRYF